jgi:hypothetical protein
MNEDTESADEAGHGDHGHHPHGTDHGDEAHLGRVTSPMQAFETTEVAFGAVIMLVGVVVTIGVPVLLG